MIYSIHFNRNSMEKKIILASASPRRRELMQQMGLEFEVITSDCDENIGICSPDEMVRELSKRKAVAVAKKLDYPSIVIGADTIVSESNRILGKPNDSEDAVNTLLSLSGKTHSVFTGMTVTNKVKTITEVVETKITFSELTRAEAEAYVATKEPMDKAGSYGIQGIGGVFIERIDGDYYSTVGLPICALRKILNSF